jgi:hypothetical protein
MKAAGRVGAGQALEEQQERNAAADEGDDDEPTPFAETGRETRPLFRPPEDPCCGDESEGGDTVLQRRVGRGIGDITPGPHQVPVDEHGEAADDGRDPGEEQTGISNIVHAPI